MAYRWKTSGLFNVDANVAVDELKRIYEQRGDISPQVIVEESENDDAPLHGLFEWDDRKAASQWRFQQARVIIANVVKVGDGEKSDGVRAFVHVKTGYQPLSVVLESPEKTDELLAQAKRELRSFQMKYRQLSELAGVMESIDEVL